MNVSRRTYTALVLAPSWLIAALALLTAIERMS